MQPCPHDDDLLGFLNESLPKERLGVVGGHVDGCPKCQQRLDRLTEETQGAAARMKEVASGVLTDAGSLLASPEHATLVLGAKPWMPAFKILPEVPGFELLAELGRGGMGVVYKARHKRLNRLVALKMILAGTSVDTRTVQRFLFEGEVLARIKHPQVVQVYEVATYAGPNNVAIPYLAMELLEGGSLSQRLRKNNTPEAPRWPTHRQAAELLEGIARAVHAVHMQGVVHRDLKPGNILFGISDYGSRNPDSPNTIPMLADSLPKVTDFGLAKFTQDSGAQLTQTGQVVGTPQYMAPEQATGGRDQGPTVDVYALGAILFECLAGRTPFPGNEPMSVMLQLVNEEPPNVVTLCPEVPRDLAAVTMKCLAKEPTRRYPSAEALADDLRRFLENRPTKARPVTTLERLWFSAKRNPAIASLLATLTLVLCTAFVAFAVLWMRAEDKAQAENRAKQSAEFARKQADDALVQVNRREAELVFARAVAWCEDGRVPEGLQLFAHAIELAESLGDSNLVRIARINYTAWERELPAVPLPLKHNEPPRFVAYHPDGKHIATASRLGELYLWEIATRKKVRTYKLSDRLFSGYTTYWSIAFSPDGNTLAAGDSHGYVTLWNTNSPDHIAVFQSVYFNKQGDENVWSVVFTSNTDLWTNDGFNGLHRWDISNPKRPQMTQHTPKTGKNTNGNQVIQFLTVSDDREKIYSGDRFGRVREWSAKTGTELREWETRGWITDVAISSDNQRMAATGTNGVVRVYDLQTGKETLTLDLAGAYGHGVAFAPKRPYLAAADADGNLRFWHRDTGHAVGMPMQFHGELKRPRFRANSDDFAIPGQDAVFLCRLPDPPGDLLSLGNGVRLRGLTISPNGEHIAIADDYAFEVRKANGELVPLKLPVNGDSLTLRYDGNPARARVLRGTRNGFDWFTATGTKLEPGWSFGLNRVSRIEFSRDQTSLYALGSGVVAKFDAQPLKLITTHLVTTGNSAADIQSLAVRPDGNEVFISRGDVSVILASDTLKPLREWAIGDEVLDATYTPNGKHVLLGRRANIAELRDANTGERVGVPMPHARAVVAVAVSPNGEVLLTGSRDGTARFWDAATGQPLGPPLRHTGPVTHLAYAPNGEHVITGTGTGYVMLWDTPPRPATGTPAQLLAKLEASRE
jgi:serine/threonine protein kinase/WD40 repeat protein